MNDADGVGAIDPDAPVGSIVGITIDGTPFAAAHHAQGWVLFEDRCTHAGCSLVLDGEIADGTVLICACHGSEFDLRDGSVLEGPATVGLSVIALEVAGGRLTTEARAPGPPA